MPRYDVPRAAEGPLRSVQLFVNSVDREHGREWLPTPRALADWFGERGLIVDSPVTSADVERAHTLREALRTLLRANNGGPVATDAVAEVNDAARRGGLELALDEDGRVTVAVRGRGADAALARIVAVAF